VTHIAPRRPGSLPWRKPHRSPGDARYGPGRPAPPSAGRGQRYPFRSVPSHARLDAWTTRLTPPLPDDLRPCVSVPANADRRGRRRRGVLWRRAGACANALRQCRRAYCPLTPRGRGSRMTGPSRRPASPRVLRGGAFARLVRRAPRRFDAEPFDDVADSSSDARRRHVEHDRDLRRRRVVEQHLEDLRFLRV
jgi:hypothetical protein